MVKKFIDIAKASDNLIFISCFFDFLSSLS